MNIAIGNYDFEGPFDDASALKQQSGVYVILGHNSTETHWTVVDVGESGDVRARIQGHDRKDCWAKQPFQTLIVAVHYCDAVPRMHIEKILRENHNPPCGDR